jgi:RHO1 GDP-GTP exchange protein 1/2
LLDSVTRNLIFKDILHNFLNFTILKMPNKPTNQVYPAILSQIATAFRSQIQLQTHVKDMLEYTDCFTGKHGVVVMTNKDVLSSIIKIKDRNVAIVVGRALDAQGFFHDVTWTSRLRDSPNELYKFGQLEGNF